MSRTWMDGPYMVPLISLRMAENGSKVPSSSWSSNPVGPLLIALDINLAKEI
jgi:hypothetical protein